MEENRNEITTKKSEFIKALVTNLQVLCHGHVPFEKNIELVGHLYLKVDSSAKSNYFLNEVVTKTDTGGTLFHSHSFYAEPQVESSTPQVTDASPSTSTKIKVVMGGNAKVASENSPTFLPKIINVQSCVSTDSSTSSSNNGKTEIQVPVPVPSPVQSQNLSYMPATVSQDTSNSMSDIIKNIKQEPCDNFEAETAVPKSSTVPISSTFPISSTVSISSPLKTSKQKRKSSHTMKIDYSTVKMESREDSPSSKKVPRIIQSRTPKKSQNPDVHNDSSQSSLEFEEIPPLFPEATSNDPNAVFPVSLLKNMAAFDEAPTVVWLNQVNKGDQSEQLRKALLNFNPIKRRGTYNFYSQEEKKKAIELAAQFGIAPICQKFGIPSSTLWTWRKAFEKYQIQKAVKEETYPTCSNKNAHL